VRRVIPVLLLAAAAWTGCARVVVTSGPQPSESNRDLVDVPMSEAWMLGIVPPREVSVREACPRGAARIQTEHSPRNVLLSVLTLGVYTPITVTVVCTAR
jgi:hypothetical protein